MYDYESIIMDCHTCAEIGCGRRECSHKDADGCEAQLLIDAACAIDELSVVVESYRRRVQLGADWISVKDHLPECDDGCEIGNVEWISNGRIYAGCFGRGGRLRDAYFREWTNGTEGMDAKDADAWRIPDIPESLEEA